jgi:hypothetical protein
MNVSFIGAKKYRGAHKNGVAFMISVLYVINLRKF